MADDSGFNRAMEMSPNSRLMIRKLRPNKNRPSEPYPWALARYDRDGFEMVIIDQFVTFEDALSEVDNIQHLIEEGKL